MGENGAACEKKTKKQTRTDGRRVRRELHYNLGVPVFVNVECVRERESLGVGAQRESGAQPISMAPFLSSLFPLSSLTR